MLLDSLAVIESIGNSRFASKSRADFAQKCREHHGYLSWKCGEQSARLRANGGRRHLHQRHDRGPHDDPACRWRDPDASAGPHGPGRAFWSDGTGRAARRRPISFAPSIDDSGRQRRYLYVGDEKAIVEMHNGLSLVLDLRDLSVVPMLLQTGWWEPSIDQLLKSVLAPA